jgi:hypothetical protein
MRYITDRFLTELFGPKQPHEWKATRPSRQLTRQEKVNRRRRESRAALFGPVGAAAALAGFFIAAIALTLALSLSSGVTISTGTPTPTPNPCRRICIDKGHDRHYCYYPQECR